MGFSPSFCLLWILIAVVPGVLAEKRGADQKEESAPKSETVDDSAETPAAERTELNLLGKTDSEAGESRRNENVQFNLIDNNALKELNQRLAALR